MFKNVFGYLINLKKITALSPVEEIATDLYQLQIYVEKGNNILLFKPTREELTIMRDKLEITLEQFA